MVMLNSGGAYLSAKTVKTGDIIKIKDEGVWEDSKFLREDGSKSQQFTVTVEYKGEDKRLKFIKASRDSFIEKHGKETNDWIGKSGQITLIPSPSGKPSIWVQPIIINPEDVVWNDK